MKLFKSKGVMYGDIREITMNYSYLFLSYVDFYKDNLRRKHEKIRHFTAGIASGCYIVY